MASVVLCWELGGGAGHLAKLSAIAAQAKQQGHRVTLVSRDICLASSMPAFAGIQLLQAPITPRHTFPEPVINYAGVLRSCGFQNPSILAPSLLAWISILRLLKAEHVVAEHAPTAVLAAKLMSLPAVMTGNGFVAPPFSDPMPSLLPWQAIAAADLRRADNTVLQTINSVVRDNKLGSAPFGSLAAAFSGARQWIQSAPELDHYQRVVATYTRREEVLFQSNPPQWPKVNNGDGQQNQVFVYFDPASMHLSNLLSQLRKSGLPVLAVIPGAAAQMVNELQNTNIRLTAERVNMAQVAEQCDIIINHAAHTTVLDLLFLGKPCILLPDTLERKLLAYRAGKAGLAFAGNTDPAQIDVQKMMDVARRTATIYDNAREFSQRHAKRGTFQPLDKLLREFVGSRT